MTNLTPQITATILGCGSSGGVPRIGNSWGECDPTNPKNRRRRCSILIEAMSEGAERPTRILIDTGCDLREQLLDFNIDAVDAVFYTHDHADHTHGIDDLRVLAMLNKKRVDVYMSEVTARRLKTAFSYCFESPEGSGYPPILNANACEAGDQFTIDGPGGAIDIEAFSQVHGNIESLGFRTGSFAYSVDLSALPNKSLPYVQDLDIWIVDSLRKTPHPSHLSLPETLNLIEKVDPKIAVLTNMHIDLDYQTTLENTPNHVFPGYDGLKVDVTNGNLIET